MASDATSSQITLGNPWLPKQNVGSAATFRSDFGYPGTLAMSSLSRFERDCPRHLLAGKGSSTPRFASVTLVARQNVASNATFRFSNPGRPKRGVGRHVSQRLQLPGDFGRHAVGLPESNWKECFFLSKKPKSGLPRSQKAGGPSAPRGATFRAVLALGCR